MRTLVLLLGLVAPVATLVFGWSYAAIRETRLKEQVLEASAQPGVAKHFRWEMLGLGSLMALLTTTGLLTLQVFRRTEQLARERHRAAEDRDPFHGNGLVRAITQDSYRAFPFLPAVEPRAYGGIYEFRTYFLKPGGLPPTLDGWREAIGPAKEYTDHLVINMIDVGEETGELDTMLYKIADNYDEEVDVAVASLVSLLEPLMVVMLGGIVGTIVVAIFYPILELQKSLS